MHSLIIHNEALYFGGAERMLGHFLDGVARESVPFGMASVKGSRISTLIPKESETIWISDNRRFSPIRLLQQGSVIRKFRRQFPFDVIHGWAARDWELASVVSWMTGRPAVGTLHDHPRAKFISPKRRFLMQSCAAWGLKKVICVSDAVREACIYAGYSPDKLITIRNGLPITAPSTPKPTSTVLRLGFLAAFSEQKGLRGLFEILDRIWMAGEANWELHLGGGAQDEVGEQLVRDLRERHLGKAWWPRVRWKGWVDRVPDFFRSVDLFIMPSYEFDSFPTVLLEAGISGTPVLAARVGGVAEIVDDGITGWLFEPGDWSGAASKLIECGQDNNRLRYIGRNASERIAGEFTTGKMVGNYLKLYSELST